MRIAVSNIGWDPADDDTVAELLVSAGVTGIEIAPTMIWPDPTAVEPAEAAGVSAEWANRGLPIVSFQALLYGHPELTVFGEAEDRDRTYEYLSRVIALAGRVGAGPLVFGSPGNRRRGELSSEQADRVGARFFRRVGETARAHGATLCLEPNPVDYGCDWVTDASAGRAFVELVDHEGFRLHLDAGGMTLAGDGSEKIVAAASTLGHFHISEPQLAPIGSGGVDHPAFAAALVEIGYEGWCSVEMRNPGDLDTLARSLEHAVSIYG